jgi:hypothetical protein
MPQMNCIVLDDWVQLQDDVIPLPSLIALYYQPSKQPYELFIITTDK